MFPGALCGLPPTLEPLTPGGPAALPSSFQSFWKEFSSLIRTAAKSGRSGWRSGSGSAPASPSLLEPWPGLHSFHQQQSRTRLQRKVTDCSSPWCLLKTPTARPTFPPARSGETLKLPAAGSVLGLADFQSIQASQPATQGLKYHQRRGARTTWNLLPPKATVAPGAARQPQLRGEGRSHHHGKNLWFPLVSHRSTLLPEDA